MIRYSESQLGSAERERNYRTLSSLKINYLVFKSYYMITKRLLFSEQLINNYAANNQ